jgi:hypothetical protein
VTDIKIGDRLKDNDPRMTGRVLTVLLLLHDRVYAHDSRGRYNWYQRKRIYTDAKPRRSGFSRIEAAK